MNPTTKRMLSTIAIIIASVAFGIVLTADLGLIRKSNAQPSSSSIQTTSGPITSVSIPSFADLAARVAPAVVSITTTEVVHTTANQKGFGIDPFEFFFPNPNDQSPGRRSPHRQQQPDDGDDDHVQRSGGSGFIISPDTTRPPTLRSSRSTPARRSRPFRSATRIASARVTGPSPSATPSSSRTR